MKKIEAIIRHYKIDDVKNALAAAGIQGMTVTEVRGYGQSKGHLETYRGAEYAVDFTPKVKVEILTTDADWQRALDVILKSARTGQLGDGKVWISDIAQVIRVRTGEVDESAL